MAFLSHVGSFDTGTGAVASTVTVTGVGFTPVAVVMWWTGQTGTSDQTTAGSHQAGFGWAVSDSSRGTSYIHNENALATMDANRANTTGSCVELPLATAITVDGAFDFTSFNADGFVLDVVNQFVASYRIHYLALGGSDITNVATGTFTRSSGSQSITTPGFTPDAVLMMSIGHTAMIATAIDAALSIGVAVKNPDSVIKQAVLSLAAADNAADDTSGHYLSTTQCYAKMTASTQVVADATSFVSMDTLGFTVDNTPFAAANIVMYLAIKGGSHDLGTLLTETDTVTEIVETGLSMNTPAAVFVASAWDTAEQTPGTGAANVQFAIGAASSPTARAAVALWGQDALAVSEVAYSMEHDAVLTAIHTDDTQLGAMDLTAVTDGGFTFLMDTVSANLTTQRIFWYWVMSHTVFTSPPADSAIWALPQSVAVPTATDILAIVDDVAGTPITKKLALSDLGSLTVGQVVVQTKTVGSGTYTPTAGMKKVLAIGVGGGGAGAGGVNTDSAGGGGGGGGTVIRLLTAANIGASKAYVVGAAGAATTLDAAGALLNAGAGGAGTAGATFSVVGVMTAGGTGGTAANGDLNIPGQPGEVGVIFDATVGRGGKGGRSVFGAGGIPGGTDAAGGAGGAYGGGGAGGHAAAASDRVGGAGAAGILYLIEFLSHG